MRKITLVLIAAACLLFLLFFGWAFAQHGTIGLFHVDSFYRSVFIIVGIVALLFIAICLLLIKYLNRFKTFVLIILIIFCIPGIAVPAAAFSVLIGFPASPVESTSPQIVMTGSQGGYGIPDMAVMYYTSKASTGTISLDRGNGAENYTEEKAEKQHVFLLQDLKPGIEYKYRINNGKEYSFTIPEPDTNELHFAIASDAHFGAGTARTDLTLEMLDNIALPANNYQAMFFLGDLVEFGFADAQWKEALPSMSTVSSRIPTVYAAGNHDTLFGGFNRFQDYLSPGIPEDRDGSRLWSRIDFGNIHFLVLDMEWSTEAFTREQEQWLEEELSAIPRSDWAIVMNHGYYFASGRLINGWNWYENPETIAAVTPIFEKYGVDMVFSGHLHQMESLEHSGVNYFICGAFGGYPEPEPTYTSSSSIWYGGGGYGFIDASIHENTAEIIFRDAENNILHSQAVNNN